MLGLAAAIPGAALAAGMPRWKFFANRVLTAFENRVMGTELSEAHTGYRAYSRELLLTVPFLRNSLDFSFDSELLYAGLAFRLSDRRGSGPLPLLRGRIFGRLQDELRLRDQDSRRPPAIAPPPGRGAPKALAEVQAG